MPELGRLKDQTTSRSSRANTACLRTCREDVNARVAAGNFNCFSGVVHRALEQTLRDAGADVVGTRLTQASLLLGKPLVELCDLLLLRRDNLLGHRLHFRGLAVRELHLGHVQGLLMVQLHHHREVLVGVA